ncbi:Ig-like domain-containing protein [Streptomyces sp. NPDC058001]|uniref:Ig-like domain-containing protein n=1 Tax=Streptomyces sp. NPDC058001 TaxID=3346300 RepID=UPI0036F06373
MARWEKKKAWKVVACTALATVVGFASPAAAAVPSSTAVQASPSSTTVGSPVSLTATVTCTGDPSGGLGMTFFDGPDILDTVPVGANGNAAYTASFSSTGTHTITAAYNGNDNCGASNGTTSVVVSTTPVPPTPPNGYCLLACGGLINFQVGDIHNEIITR